MASTSAQVDYRLLENRSDQVLCSRCLKRGIRTPVVQVISERHRLQSLCRGCRAPATPRFNTLTLFRRSARRR